MGKLFSREGHTPFLIISNVLIWISSIIVMGILSYWIDQQPRQPNHLVYEEVTVGLVHLTFYHELDFRADSDGN